MIPVDDPHGHENRDATCCWACWEAAGTRSMFFLVCGECGNKRCPKAADHDWDCTRSNDVGQDGSAYQHGSGAATSRRLTSAWSNDILRGNGSEEERHDRRDQQD
ncbi:MAG: hypothetical protein EOO40_10095 [Deltaproteobacteria bacterium]|nr:MAG: hypothetical protein EOO40_10095 [Deltaproteobacteria bacterium]